MATGGLTFAITAGEASGDANGAALVEAIRRLQPGARFVGVGGRRMQEAGVELLYDSSQWGAIGIVESLRLVAPLTRAKDDLVARWSVDRPDLIIPVDFGHFNVRLAYPLRQAGLRVLYYFPPRSWSREGHVSPRLKEAVTAVAAPFPWAAERFQEAGVPAAFVGHPLLETAAIETAALETETPQATASDFAEPDEGGDERRKQLCREFGLDPGSPIVALLPGSRRHEVRYLWPRLWAAAREVAGLVAGVQFITPVAPNADRAWMEQIAGRGQTGGGAGASAPPLRLINGRTTDVLAVSDVVAACSGTATLEAAVLGKPMMILYGGSWLMVLEWLLRKPRLGVTYIGMPNILAGREIVREMLQWEAAGPSVAAEILRLLTDQEAVRQMTADLQEAVRQLGSPGAASRAAELAVALAQGQSPEEASARASILESSRL